MEACPEVQRATQRRALADRVVALANQGLIDASLIRRARSTGLGGAPKIESSELLRASAYADFLRDVSLLARSGTPEQVLESEAVVGDARARIALYGSEAVVRATARWTDDRRRCLESHEEGPRCPHEHRRLVDGPCPRERARPLDERSGGGRPSIAHLRRPLAVSLARGAGGARSRIALFFRAVRRRGLEPRCPFGR